MSKYTDFDLRFTMLNNGDIAKRKDDKSVHDGIKNLLLLATGDKPYDLDMGVGINRLLFKSMGRATELAIQRDIENMIEAYEKRANIDCTECGVNVEADIDTQQYHITIDYAIENDGDIFRYTTYLTAIR